MFIYLYLEFLRRLHLLVSEFDLRTEFIYRNIFLKSCYVNFLKKVLISDTYPFFNLLSL